MPPNPAAVALPLQEPLQITDVLEIICTDAPDVFAMILLAEAEQPKASVAITVYVPDAILFITEPIIALLHV